jgi:hypothetical protein
MLRFVVPVKVLVIYCEYILSGADWSREGFFIDFFAGFLQYFGLVILLFLSEFIVGALAFVFRGGIGRTLANELRYGE